MFKARIDQIDVIDALKKIRATVGKGKDESLDNMVYMEGDDIGGQPIVRFITNNGTEFSIVEAEAVSAVAGQSAPLVEFDRLLKLVETIDNSLTLDFDTTPKNELSFTYQGRRTPIKLVGLPNDKFLLPPEVQGASSIEMPLSIFKDGISVASTVINDDDRYPLYNCVNVVVKGGKVTFEAIDSKYRRMVACIKSCTHIGEGTFFIEATKAKKLLAGFDSSKTVEILLSNNNAEFIMDNASVAMRLQQGTFPNCLSYMPSQYITEVTFARQDMILSLERARIMTEDQKLGFKSCILNIENGMIEINLNNTFGMLFENVICTQKGDPIRSAYRIESLLDALKSIDEPDVTLSFPKTTICLLQPVSSSNIHKCLIPAVRLNDGAEEKTE